MKIKNLDIREQTLRDLYLRKLALGEIQGPPTGYASIDKPWLKYFDEEAIIKDFEPMSIYQLMKSRNIGHENEIALDYFGKKITYGELLKNIDITAKSLLELGVKKGDIVMMSMPNTPEAEYLFYAINKMGAVINSIDPRTSEEVIKQDELKNVELHHNRAEDFAKENREKFDVATSRAVAALPVLLEYLLPLVKVGGKCICMKGSNIQEEIEQAKTAIHVLGGEIEQVEKMYLPDTEMERNIVIIKKIKNTPTKYPRKAGTPAKEPIL